jgi:hypothetical protein
MRSEIITVSQTSLDIEDDKYKFGYYFQSSNGSLPSKAEVMVYGPAIDNFKKYWGPEEGEKNLGWNYVNFPQDVIQVGGDWFTVVISGVDGQVNNKAHRPKLLLERNARSKQPTAAVFQWPLDAYTNKVVQDSIGYLRSGAFLYRTTGVLTDKVKFAPNWSILDKRGLDLGNAPRILPIDLGEGESQTGAAALKNVDVFAFYEHSSGYGIGFGMYLPVDKGGIICDDLSNYQGWHGVMISLWDGNIFPGNAPLRNLKLAVVVACNPRGIVLPEPKFPIVRDMWVRGAKLAIGVCGSIKQKAWYMEQNQKKELDVRGILFSHEPNPSNEWIKKFWQYVSKGLDQPQKDPGTNHIVYRYPTVMQAARIARAKVHAEFGGRKYGPFKVQVPDQQHPGQYKWVEVNIEYPKHDEPVIRIFSSGSDNYLGNLVWSTN